MAFGILRSGMSTDTQFEGITALITGASSGIGAATALAFGSRGAHVIVHCNQNTKGAEEVLASIERGGGTGSVLAADLSASSGVASFTEQLRALERPIDILVNNAGSLIRRTKTLDFTPELWDQVITLNLSSTFFVTQAVLPGMVARGRGFVVNVSSVAAKNGGGLGAVAYATAKAAVSTMTKGLAKEFALEGIRVNAVSPGTIDNNFHKTFSTSLMLDAVKSATPMGRLGTSEEVADVILFLCSDAARFIQGQVIEVNGGFLMA